MNGCWILRWIARIWSIASILFILAFAFGGAESLRFTIDEAVYFLLFPVGVMIGLMVGWWREGTGGTISLASLGLFYLRMAIQEGRVPTGPYFLLLAAPGLLFLVSSLWCRRPKRNLQTALPQQY